MDARRVPGSQPARWEVFTHTGADGGRGTGIDAVEWACKAVDLGAGEIVVNSIDADGTRCGYDLELLRSDLGKGERAGGGQRRSRPA